MDSVSRYFLDLPPSLPSAAFSSLSSFLCFFFGLPLLLYPWGVPTHILLLLAKRFLHQYVKSSLPPVTLAHATTVLHVRQGETKIPLKIFLSDKKNTKTKLKSTEIHFVGASNVLIIVQEISPTGRAPNYRSVLLLAGRENITRGVKVVRTNTVIKVILSTLKYPPHELSALKTSLLLRNAISMH